MSDIGPLGDDEQNPFSGLPIFGDIAKLIQQQGASSWSTASQLAVSVATGGESEANVEPLERIKYEQLARVAELQVANATGLTVSTSANGITIIPVNRATWVHRSLDTYQPFFEKLSEGLATPPDDSGEPVEAGDPTAALMGGLMQLLGPMMLSMTAGSMLGHLAQRSLGQYDLPIPRDSGDEIMVVAPNVAAFGEEWSLGEDDLRLWICLHEISHHAVLGVPHIRSTLTELLDRYATGFRSDGDAMERRMGELDLGDMTDPSGFQKMFGDPEIVLGAIRSPEQEAVLPQLRGLVCVLAGYIDHLMDTVGTGLIGSYGMLTEALRRRRVQATDADRFVEKLLGLELTQEQYDRGTSFVQGVVERAGEDGIRRLFDGPDNLPTPSEVDAPGLWLARIDLDPPALDDSTLD